uniref:TlpA family protein disulfide reductase n=1 Tax=Pedobacter schmidteae TaxID=2201271 RepID=UPI000EAD93D3|nr:hypothetical protein [Pedobacter schmidteae]
MKRLYTLLLILVTIEAYAQVKLKPLAIGDKIPDRIWKLIPKKATSKLIILDMWSTYCTSCMAGFPKMNELQQKFNKELWVVLLNPFETQEAINKRLESVRGYNDKPIIVPSLPMLNKDHLAEQLLQLFPATRIPLHIWISDRGIVEAITQPYNANSEHVENYLAGKKLNLVRRDDMLGKQLIQTGLMRPYNSSPQNVYYSAILPFSDATNSGGGKTDTLNNIERYWINNRSVLELYEMAYPNDRVLLEMQSKEKFIRPQNLTDDWVRRYTFNYEIQLPLSDKNNYKSYLQEDLNRFFGSMFNITGGIERRKFKCYVLVKTSDQYLKKTEDKYIQRENQSDIYYLENPTIGDVASFVSEVLQDLDNGNAFLNEADADDRYNYSIKLELNKETDNLTSLKQKLNKYGLDIIETERMLDVRVIKDKPSKKI